MGVVRWPIVVAALVGCGPVIPPVPSRGGPEWFELRTEHFVLWTDASRERGQQMLDDMELRRQIIMRAMNDAPQTAPVFALALRNASEVQAYLADNLVAAAWNEHNASRQPGIMLSAAYKEVSYTLNHELSHVISYGIIRRQPDWLAEGLASYFETAKLDFDRTSVALGHPRDDHAWFLRTRQPRPSIAELFACHSDACRDRGFYATSWAAFAFLLNERNAQFASYLGSLNTSRASYAELWRRAFPDLPPDRFDRELSEWLITGKARLPKIKLAIKASGSDHARRLSDGDVLAARGLLHYTAAHDRGAARLDVEQALALDHSNVLAHLVHKAITRSITVADGQELVAAHPDDWRAWLLLSSALPDGTEAHQALTRLCTLNHAVSECDDGSDTTSAR